ncbi:hypothetical protein AMS68_001321 [Peltaster fructicola]|uniref:UFSP1/2/DUB catalytic domain-containing protein n=1 Tax=Peltaster fructicola TaxID=286661 RepID=A0A6H0XM53_9PEZI|nr:hypothetical protein AMS68_001321 [Peltaster fructicola]
MEIKRLGRELGPYAFEERMPHRVDALLQKDGSNVITNVIPKLAQLLRSSDVKAARLCRQDAVLIHKHATEGNTFCGYRNIQMLLHPMTAKRLYTVPELQNMIETAWTRGFNAHGRDQTGGVRGTRKYIGTSEAEALMQSLDIDCTGFAFQGTSPVNELFTHLDTYFGLGEGIDITRKMPVYLQLPKHSILVVGIARRRNGSKMLLVFDPAKPPPLNMSRTPNSKLLQSVSGRLQVAACKKSERSLRRYSAFETLVVEPEVDLNTG